MISASSAASLAALPVWGARILFLHVDIYAFGGAEIHCIRAMGILQDAGAAVTLVHGGMPLDAKKIEDWCGVRLDPDRVTFISIPGLRTLKRLVGNFALLQYAMAHLWARRLVPECDLVATIFAECTLKAPRVVQYVAYPNFVIDEESLAHLGNRYGSRLRLWLRVFYQRCCRAIAGWDRDVVRSHVTLANSSWTARQFQRQYGADAPVEPLYVGAEVAMPPREVARLSFTQRGDNFVVIGRVVPGKRVELAIEIVRRLREEKGHDVGLRIVGRASEPYASSIRRLIADKPWIVWHEGLPRVELEREVSSQKWGLHCYEFEHYGIAPAELQMLGCITFVPDDGGQAEIVSNPALRYRDADDAVIKIDRVLCHPEEHGVLLAQAAASNEIHRAEKFAIRYLEIVRAVLDGTWYRQEGRAR